MTKEVAYRPDIDGLRAIAVTAVLLYHAFPAMLPGGFSGVDVFFVISGFLITEIISRDLISDQFSVARFYERRIRRIFPALTVVLAFTFAAGYLYLVPSDLVELGKSTVAGVFFFSNFLTYSQLGYFDKAAELKPLLHLWSLSVEEQFYIFWPLTLMLAYRRRYALPKVIAGLCLVSFVLCVVRSSQNQPAAFFIPVYRAWELLIGALAFSAGREMRPSAQTLLSIVGALLLLCGFYVINDKSIFPGWLALVPTIGTAILLLTHQSRFNTQVLGSRGLVAVGLISYPLYLWHWPLLSYARIVAQDTPTVSTRIFLLVASVALATATYWLLERPIRRRGFLNTKAIVSSAALTAVGCLGVFAVFKGGLPERMPAQLRAGLESSNVPFQVAHWRPDTCFLNPSQNKSDFAPECAGDGSRPTALLWGDSYAAALYPGASESAKRYGVNLAQYTSSCGPVYSQHKTDTPRTECKDLTDFILNEVKELRPDIVLIHARWPEYDLARLGATVDELRKLQIGRIVVIGPVPNWKGGLAPTMLQYYREHLAEKQIPDRSTFHLIGQQTEQAVHREAVRVGVEYLSTWNVLCDGNGCLTSVDGRLAAIDEMHLSIQASKFVAGALLDPIFASLKATPPRTLER